MGRISTDLTGSWLGFKDSERIDIIPSTHALDLAVSLHGKESQ